MAGEYKIFVTYVIDRHVCTIYEVICTNEKMPVKCKIFGIIT